MEFFYIITLEKAARTQWKYCGLWNHQVSVHTRESTSLSVCSSKKLHESFCWEGLMVWNHLTPTESATSPSAIAATATRPS